MVDIPSSEEMKRSEADLQAEQNRADEDRRVFIAQKQSLFLGPIPPPAVLAGYEDVQDGLAARIVTMAEDEQKHRHKCQREALASSAHAMRMDHARKMISQTFAFAIAVIAILGGLIQSSMTKSSGGLVVSGTSLVALVGLFIYDKERRRSSELRGKQPVDADHR